MMLSWPYCVDGKVRNVPIQEMSDEDLAWVSGLSLAAPCKLCGDWHLGGVTMTERQANLEKFKELKRRK